ncbi:MAG TPA: FAD-binding protein [archaeon]|nr:FAD-binding protein [archaeon]
MIHYRTYELDGIVIGGGGAGLKAAIETHEKGSKVAVVMKCLLGKAHTVMAEGGMAASMNSSDNPKKHFIDTIMGGYGMNDWESVWRMVNKARDIILYLESKGAIFDRNDSGSIEPRAFGGHGERRTCHVSDRTGHAIIHTLQNELLRENIQFFEKTIVTSLIVKGGKIVGATAIDIRSGEFILFKTKFVILATGGCGDIYKYTTNSKDLTGDGVHLAFEAGAELMDMEMIQFHPTCMLEPEEKRGILVTEACRGEGGILINGRGERFMKSATNPDGTAKYPGKLGHPELETRDVVARAIEEEYAKNLGPVKLIICRKTWNDEKRKMRIKKEYRKLVNPKELLDEKGVKERLSTTYEQFKKFVGIDVTKEGMVIRPAQHYMMGGVRTDGKTCMSRVKGLFAAGEVATGVHGANRLGGNSLTDIQVEGVIAGQEAAKYAKSAKHLPVNENEMQRNFSNFLKLFGKAGIKQSEVRKELHELMWKYAGIKRDKKGLETGLKELQKLKAKGKKIKVEGGLRGNVAWQEAIETIGMLNVGEAILRSALMRQESRGSHYRLDYPKMDKSWLVNVISKKVGSKTVITKIKINRMPRNLLLLFPKKWLDEVYGK